MRRGEVPRQWKEAKLVLIPKGNQEHSFRPVCLLNAIAKTFEKILVHRLESHLEKVKGISDKQYGFRKGRTTTDAIMELHRLIRERRELGAGKEERRHSARHKERVQHRKLGEDSRSSKE